MACRACRGGLTRDCATNLAVLHVPASVRRKSEFLQCNPPINSSSHDATQLNFGLSLSKLPVPAADHHFQSRGDSSGVDRQAFQFGFQCRRTWGSHPGFRNFFVSFRVATNEKACRSACHKAQGDMELSAVTCSRDEPPPSPLVMTSQTVFPICDVTCQRNVSFSGPTYCRTSGSTLH